MVDTDTQLVEAALGASQRSRTALYALVVFCMLLAISFINQMDKFTWFDERFDLLLAARTLYSCPTIPGELSIFHEVKGQLYTPAPQTSQTSIYSHPLPERLNVYGQQRIERVAETWVGSCSNRLPPNSNSSLFTRAAKMILLRGYSRSEVEKQLELTRASRHDNLMLVSVPIIGIKIDGNALGFFAAGAHLVLLLWLFIAFKQEILLLDRVCSRLHNGYEIVRAHSFFAPSTNDASRPFRAMLTATGWLSVWLPFLLTTSLFVNDLRSLGHDPPDLNMVYDPALVRFYMLGEAFGIGAGLYVAFRVASAARAIVGVLRRGHVPWKEKSAAWKVNWVLERLCKVSVYVPRQRYGRTITEMLWLRHGVTASDIEPVLRALGASTPNEILSALGESVAPAKFIRDLAKEMNKPSWPRKGFLQRAWVSFESFPLVYAESQSARKLSLDEGDTSILLNKVTTAIFGDLDEENNREERYSLNVSSIPPSRYRVFLDWRVDVMSKSSELGGSDLKRSPLPIERFWFWALYAAVPIIPNMYSTDMGSSSNSLEGDRWMRGRQWFRFNRRIVFNTLVAAAVVLVTLSRHRIAHGMMWIITSFSPMDWLVSASALKCGHVFTVMLAAFFLLHGAFFLINGGVERAARGGKRVISGTVTRFAPGIDRWSNPKWHCMILAERGNPPKEQPTEVSAWVPWDIASDHRLWMCVERKVTLIRIFGRYVIVKLGHP